MSDLFLAVSLDSVQQDIILEYVFRETGQFQTFIYFDFIEFWHCVVLKYDSRIQKLRKTINKCKTSLEIFHYIEYQKEKNLMENIKSLDKSQKASDIDKIT